MIPKWTYIVLHHSLTKDSGTVSWSAIRKYHIDTNGWNEIGYNWGVELINGYYEVLMGRSLTEIGAHCKDSGMNKHGIGICMIGDFDIAMPPLSQWVTTVKLIRMLMAIFHIPGEHVIGHRDAGKENRHCK